MAGSLGIPQNTLLGRVVKDRVVIVLSAMELRRLFQKPKFFGEEVHFFVNIIFWIYNL